MTTPPDQGNTYEAWFDYARGDLAGAQTLLNSHEIDPRLACGHIQQGIEKALKGALISEGIQPERTHDLKNLINMLPSSWNGRLHTTMDLERVSSWASDIRYPGEVPQVSRSNAETTLDKARTLVEEIECGISMRGDNSGLSL